MFIFTIWVPSWLGPHPPHWVKNLWCRASISSPLDASLEVRFFGRQAHILFTRKREQSEGIGCYARRLLKMSPSFFSELFVPPHAPPPPEGKQI